MLLHEEFYANRDTATAARSPRITTDGVEQQHVFSSPAGFTAGGRYGMHLSGMPARQAVSGLPPYEG